MNRKFAIVRRTLTALCCVALLLSLTACMGAGENDGAASDVPPIPERLSRNADGIPLLKVYNTASGSVEEMDLESYIMGVVAGEMKNSWPMEALKAQAILARTFTMKFLTTKTSGYEGADISTDVQEAQAYNADAINNRIREAVNETRGIVMAYDGDFTQAWFHAHSGGVTELPTKALEYSEDPAYLKIVESPESDQAPEEVQNWTASFSRDQVRKACAGAGTKVESIESFEIGKKGDSGRAVTFLVNGEAEVSAPTFRLQIGASDLKSTLIHSIEIDGDDVVFTGSGFGHGVGMSQWGAHRMAEEGKSAEDIVEYYYSDVDLVELW